MTRTLSPPSYPIDHLARRGAAEAPALLIGDGVMGFADLDAGVGRLAAWLREQAGGPGERVASWSAKTRARSEEHTSELQSLMRISYAVFFLKKKKNNQTTTIRAR